MKIKPCPFCAETPRPIGIHIEHHCQLIGVIQCLADDWNTRLKPEKPKKFIAAQPELGLKIERSPAQIARDLLLCALAAAELNEPVSSLTSPEAKRHAAALKDIQLMTPGVTVLEIERRARNYRTHFDSDPTSHALAKWWRKCEQPARRTWGRPTVEQKAAISADQDRKERNNLARQFGLPPT
jgi:hypothetical protein